MSQFNEANSVRDFVRDLVASDDVQFVPGSSLPRQAGDVLLENQVKEALVRLNPEIRADPRRADEVLYHLRAIIQSARHTPNPVVANEQFAAWLIGQKSMPFGPGGEHVAVRLIDLDDPAPSANHWIVSTEVTFSQGRVGRRFDLVVWCNGFPLVVGEAKSPVRPAYTWIDAARADPRGLREERPDVLRAQRALLRHRGQGPQVRLRRHARRVVGAVARRRNRRDAPAKSGLAAVEESVEGC